MSANRPHPYPAVRSGGLFLTIVGSGITVGGLLGERVTLPVFYGSFAAGFIALSFFGERLRAPLGRVTKRQGRAMLAAIILEIVLIVAAVVVFNDDLAHGQLRRFLLSILLAVGIHFFVFAIAQGPLMLLLGSLCIINAAIAWAIPTIPITVVWILDGLIKIGVGISMLRTPVPARPLTSAS